MIRITFIVDSIQFYAIFPQELFTDLLIRVWVFPDLFLVI